MKAVGEFAAGRDQGALRHLHTAAGKPRWDDHAVDETRAQWKLLQAAYGDHGVLQKLPGSHTLLLPHFGQIRAAARLAIWHAAQREQAGDLASAFGIRHDVMQLGMHMAEVPPGVIGKWISLDLVDTGSSADLPGPPPYERILRAHGEAGEADWVHEERARADALRGRLGRLYGPENTYPPGLLALWWVFDLMLLRQAAGLLLLWCGAALLGRARGGLIDESKARTTVKWVLLSLAVFLTPIGMGAVVGAVRVTEGSLDASPILRLVASVLVLWSGSVLIARVGGREERVARSVKVLRWLSASLGLLMTPFVLVAIAGPDLGLWGTVGTGTLMAVLLGLARRTGRRAEQGERPPRWQPGLVALGCVLPSTLFLALSCLILGSVHWENALEIVTEFSVPVLMLVLVPALLLTFAALCRVAALDLPLRAGLLRAVRQMIPYAMALLALIYIAALVPTLAGDRASQHSLDQVFSRDLSSSQAPR
jgi:hypothetical protein